LIFRNTVDFVIPSPGESLIKAFDKWMEWAKKSVCDYAFHVVVSWWSDQVREEMGILARERGQKDFVKRNESILYRTIFFLL
jgi:dihydropyrimidinase